MEVKKCILTGLNLANPIIIESDASTIEYESKYAGKVKLTYEAFVSLKNELQLNKVIAGINLHNYLANKEEIFIDSSFINEGYKTYQIPNTFEEKCLFTLKGLYLLIGKENKTLEQDLIRYSALGYTEYEEFCRIIEQLYLDNYIQYSTKKPVHRRQYTYLGVTVTKSGKKRAKEMLPNFPLINLVDNTITTGDSEIDSKINFAKDLFFKNPNTMENMRSACERLSFVLEPLRDELRNCFSSNDVSDFFNIVNRFDIRHNKDSTKNMQYPEQLEWVFYTLLNSIVTYYKLKEKMKPNS